MPPAFAAHQVVDPMTAHAQPLLPPPLPISYPTPQTSFHSSNGAVELSILPLSLYSTSSAQWKPPPLSPSGFSSVSACLAILGGSQVMILTGSSLGVSPMATSIPLESSNRFFCPFVPFPLPLLCLFCWVLGD